SLHGHFERARLSNELAWLTDVDRRPIHASSPEPAGAGDDQREKDESEKKLKKSAHPPHDSARTETSAGCRRPAARAAGSCGRSRRREPQSLPRSSRGPETQ